MDKKTKIKFNVLAIFCIIIFCFALTPITFQNDTYYTIAIGKHIVETGNIDMQDPFSWHEDLPYTYPHWGYDVGTYLVYQLGENISIGGFTAIYIATVLLCMVLGIVMYIACTKICKNNLISFFITMGVMWLLKDFITARAQLVTFILFALTILFIEQFIETKKKRYPIMLVLISIIIANIHCAVWPFYFVLYVPYIAEYILAIAQESNFIYKFQIKYKKFKIKKLENKLKKQPKEAENNISKSSKENNIESELTTSNQIEMVSKRKVKETQSQKLVRLEKELEELKETSNKVCQKDKERRENPYKVVLKKESAVKWLIIVLIICAFTGLLTPLGTTPYTYLAKTMEGNTTQNISEHQPLTLINNKPMLCVFSAFVLILIFTDSKLKLRDYFMIAGLLLLCFMSRRQTSIFVIVCGFIFAKLVANFLEKYSPKVTTMVVNYMNTILGKTLVALIVILCSMLLFREKIGDKFVSISTYPVDASNYILENLDLENMKLFNEYNYGSYLLYRGIPVFIDSRAELYSPEFNGTQKEDGSYEGRDIFSDYINVSNISTYYEDKFEYYGITHVITGAKTKLNMFLSRDDNYTELYSDDYFVIYERTDN